MYWLREELKASNPVEPPHELPICTRNKGWHGNVHEAGVRPYGSLGRLLQAQLCTLLKGRGGAEVLLATGP